MNTFILVLALLATTATLAAPIQPKDASELNEHLIKQLQKAEISLKMQRRFLETFDEDSRQQMLDDILNSIARIGDELSVLAHVVKPAGMEQKEVEKPLFDQLDLKFASFTATCDCPAHHDCIDGVCIASQSVCPMNCPPDWACINGKCIDGS